MWTWEPARRARPASPTTVSPPSPPDTPYFTDAERAALALAEHAARLPDRAEAVPDAVSDEAARHVDEPALAALVLAVAVTNLFNRVNVTTRQPAGTW